MNAEQYRALVAKLEAINEAPVAAFNQNAGATPDASAPVGSVAADPAVAPTETPAPTPTPATDPNQIPTIEAATFSQAYAQARKQGLKKFKWCGVYAVKDKVNPQPVPPKPVKPAQGKVDYVGQADPLGGDAQNPMSFASNSNFGA
jgi:hypothetical protein